MIAIYGILNQHHIQTCIIDLAFIVRLNYDYFYFERDILK